MVLVVVGGSAVVESDGGGGGTASEDSGMIVVDSNVVGFGDADRFSSDGNNTAATGSVMLFHAAAEGTTTCGSSCDIVELGNTCNCGSSSTSFVLVFS